jgi:hypothetical protein
MIDLKIIYKKIEMAKRDNKKIQKKINQIGIIIIIEKKIIKDKIESYKDKRQK